MDKSSVPPAAYSPPALMDTVHCLQVLHVDLIADYLLLSQRAET